MALSKPFYHLIFHVKPYRVPPAPVFIPRRFLSFATPEEAAAERRRRKRRLRIEPPLGSLRHSPPRPQKPSSPPQNPNAPKLPETVAALTGNRLNLHNRILTLIRENDLDEASLLVRHSIYSNCRPTVFTCNAVLAALLRQSRYADLLSLHRFITQASVSPTIVTYNLLLQAYCDCRKADLAFDHYKQLLNSAPFAPSPTTYRILSRGLADVGQMHRALPLKDEMVARGLSPDPVVYAHLMTGAVKSGDPDKAVELFSELREKSGGSVSDGMVYGPLIHGFLKKGMEKEAMDCYNELILGIGNGGIRMGAVGYNLVLDALSKNGKFETAMVLFSRIMGEHNPPRRLSVNLGSFNVMVDMFCKEKKFDEAVELFQKMGEKRCSPDTLSCNNLIEQLCANGLLPVAEKIFEEMSQKAVSPDEYTYVLLLDACFEAKQVDAAAAYFTRMVEAGLRPNVVVYNKLLDGLVKADRLDQAKGFFDQMAERELKPDPMSYDIIMRGFYNARRLDDMLKMVGDTLSIDDGEALTPEMRVFVADALKEEGRVEELTRLYEEKKKEKEEKAAALAREAEAAALAKEAESAALAREVEALTAANAALAKRTEVTSSTDAATGDKGEANHPGKGDLGRESTMEAEVIDGSSKNGVLGDEAAKS